jgi:hypothetical protein
MLATFDAMALTAAYVHPLKLATASPASTLFVPISF